MKNLIASHYAHGYGEERVKQALENIGPLDDTAALDEFHVRGREGTRDLVECLGVSQDDLLLDCGCGPGGAVRWVTRGFGSRVIGIDVTFPFLKVAHTLSVRARLDEKNIFVAADALKLPFRPDTFSAVICQHMMMNVPDKGTLVEEWYRVLKEGGKVALNEIARGEGEPDYPVPWARDRNISYLIAPGELLNLLIAKGFQICHYKDTTDLARQWFSQVSSKTERINLKLLMGDEIGPMSRNLKRALEDGRLKVVEIVARKGSGRW